MSRHIQICQDYIFVADIYKNFQVYKLKNEEELKKQKIEDKNIISLLKRYQAKADAHCIYIHPIKDLSARDQDLSTNSIFTAS